jgi:phosphatidate cytidylyltransferase
MTSTRIAAGLVGLAILLPTIVWGGGVGIGVVVALAMAVALAEYAGMAFPDDRVAAFVWLAITAYPVALASVWGSADVLAVTLAAVVVGTMIWVTLRPGPDLADAADRVGRSVLGATWIGGLLPFLVRLRELPDGVAWVILALVVSWAGDTGAYFAGRRFGATPLYPRVSPKKTREGLVGGVAGSVIGVLALRWLALPRLDAVDVVVLGAVGCLVGVVGDLAESLLKRSFDVKDSGWILPGHGGILDRIDSLLFVAPFVWAWAAWSVG